MNNREFKKLLEWDTISREDLFRTMLLMADQIAGEFGRSECHKIPHRKLGMSDAQLELFVYLIKTIHES